MKKIGDIKKGENISILALVNQKNIGISNNGRQYLSLILADKNNKIDAKFWDVDQTIINNIKEGQVYKFKGFSNEYRNSLQLKITSFEILNNSKINWDNFVKKAPIDVEIEYKNLLSEINKFKNKNYQKLLLEILKKYGEKFKIWPAATKYHHSIKNGLLWHTISMLKTAKALKLIYLKQNIDFELLFSGIILHDFGKVIEINVNGVLYEFSLKGKLIGHISIMVNELSIAANKLKIDNDDLTLLKHMIIASHGKLEFGSPIQPAILEAEILTLLDNLDARIYTIDNECSKMKDNGFTTRISSLEQRIFYNHKNT